jgi:hypothetical protein
MDEISAEKAPVTEIWSRTVFRALGNGDLVEQDVLVTYIASLERAIADQRANRRFLTEREY